MVNSFVFTNGQMVSNRRVLDFKSPGPGFFNMGDRGTTFPKLKSVSVNRLVNLSKSVFLLEEKIGIDMLFTLQNRYHYG